MKILIAMVPPVILLAGCASAGGLSMSSSTPEYWRGTSSSVDEFRHDNVVCSSRAAKFGNLDQASIPQNGMDRPMGKWPNATAQETYETCMHDLGWRPAA